MADGPSDIPRPDAAGPGPHGPGVPKRSSGPSTGQPPGQLGQARPLPPALVQAMPALIELLMHEPAVGLALVDTHGRAVHANRRFGTLTGPAGHGSGDRRRGMWSRIGPEAVRAAATERRPTVTRFIQEGVGVQCDVWPLPVASAGEPLFLAVAFEGRHDPAAEPDPASQPPTAPDKHADRAPAESAPDTASDPGQSSSTVEPRPAAPSGQAPSFVTLAPILAELGALSALTARELEVLALIGQGMATNEIAKALDRSPRTIERHCDQIHKKLGTSNRVQMAKHALQAGLTRDAGRLKRV